MEATESGERRRRQEEDEPDPPKDEGTHSTGDTPGNGRKEEGFHPNDSTRILRARARQFAVRGRFTISGIFRGSILTGLLRRSHAPLAAPLPKVSLGFVVEH